MERVAIKNTSPGGEPVRVDGSLLAAGDTLTLLLEPGRPVRLASGVATPPQPDDVQTAAVPNPYRNADPPPAQIADDPDPDPDADTEEA